MKNWFVRLPLICTSFPPLHMLRLEKITWIEKITGSLTLGAETFASRKFHEEKNSQDFWHKLSQMTR